jgi:hypothetical protein
MACPRFHRHVARCHDGTEVGASDGRRMTFVLPVVCHGHARPPPNPRLTTSSYWDMRAPPHVGAYIASQAVGVVIPRAAPRTTPRIVTEMIGPFHATGENTVCGSGEREARDLRELRFSISVGSRTTRSGRRDPAAIGDPVPPIQRRNETVPCHSVPRRKRARTTISVVPIISREIPSVVRHNDEAPRTFPPVAFPPVCDRVARSQHECGDAGNCGDGKRDGVSM